MAVPPEIPNVTVKPKANVYFDGKVISHTLTFPDGRKKTAGLIYPGTYRFNTDAPERMELIAGAARVRVAGATEWTDVAAGGQFRVPGRSSFDIEVGSGLTEYLCSFE